MCRILNFICFFGCFLYCFAHIWKHFEDKRVGYSRVPQSEARLEGSRHSQPQGA